MKRYTHQQEERIRARCRVSEWQESGLIDAGQLEALSVDLKVDLRETNEFLRLLLFLFGVLVVFASVVLGVTVFNLNDDSSAALWLFCCAAACVGLAETFASNVYRYGIEEAFAVSSVVLAGVGAFILSSNELFGGCLTAAAAAGLIYLRYGYLYAALGSIGFLVGACFTLEQTPTIERVLAVLVVSPIFLFMRIKRRESGDDFPGDDYAKIEAAAWLTLYGVVNLHLLGRSIFKVFPPPFYWSTYVLIWLLPAAGIYLALRERSRLLLDSSLVMALATLATNKPYLGLERKAWDPILFGAFLIGTAVVVRRWLATGAGGERFGYTPLRILNADKRTLAVVGTASSAIRPDAPQPSHSVQDFKPGGGRSGGAGAGGTF